MLECGPARPACANPAQGRAAGRHLGTPRISGNTREDWIYATSLKLLMLEVYYRHLPLYQVLEQ